MFLVASGLRVALVVVSGEAYDVRSDFQASRHNLRGVYRFLLRPKWLLSHVLVLALLAAMVGAMLWQVDRLQEKRALNDRIEARTDVAVAPVEGVLAPNGSAKPDDFEYRQVTATGVIQRADEVLVRNRPLNGAPGTWVLSPLVLADGRAVIVNRGWIPNTYKPGEERAGIDAPTGQVRVSGYLRTTETARGLQVPDPAEGQLTSLARPDIERYARMVDYELLPMWLQLVNIEDLSVPSDEVSNLPVPLALPELSEGPHRSYAVQWAVYSLIALFGYPLILRRLSRNRSVG